MMDQYAKEAIFRENLLGQKLQMLEEQLVVAQDALQTSWQSLINEEQLLSRIEMLESQLAIMATKQHPGNEEKFRQIIHELQEDKAEAETVAKDSLRKGEEQLCETSMRLHDAENGLLNQEEENTFLRQKCHDFERGFLKQREEYEELLGRYSDTLIQLECKDKRVNNSIGEGKMVNGNEQISDEVLLNKLETAMMAHTEKSSLLEKIRAIVSQGDTQWIEVPAEPCGTDEKYAILFENQDTCHICLSEKRFPTSTDFQVCLLTTFPFVLIMLMVLSPIYYLWPFGNKKIERKVNLNVNKVESGNCSNEGIIS